MIGIVLLLLLRPVPFSWEDIVVMTQLAATTMTRDVRRPNRRALVLRSVFVVGGQLWSTQF